MIYSTTLVSQNTWTYSSIEDWVESLVVKEAIITEANNDPYLPSYKYELKSEVGEGGYYILILNIYKNNVNI